MAAKRRSLGRGLDALLGEGGPAGQAAEAALTEGELRDIPIELLERGRYQPRKDISADGLNDLADSIRAQGVVQPVVVRPLEGGRFELIAGERRWRAAQIAGLHEIPAVVRDVPDQAAVAMALIENIQRENLNPLEEANALQRLIEEFGLTHQDTAEAVGRSRVAVTNLLRLLELNDDVKARVDRGELELGHARCLLSLKGDEQSEAGRRVASRGLSVRETERLVKRLQHESVGGNRDGAHSGAATTDPDVRHLQDQLSERLGARVRLEHSQSGKGRLVIQYGSLDELDGILNHIK